MDIAKILHKISHLKWVFLLIQIVLLIYCFFVLPENLISVIGILVLASGLQMGLESLADVEKISQKEAARYLHKNLANRLSKIILTALILTVLISLLFITLNLFGSSRNEKLFTDFLYLGINLWALVLGFLCLLKSINDKNEYVKINRKN